MALGEMDRRRCENAHLPREFGGGGPRLSSDLLFGVGGAISSSEWRDGEGRVSMWGVWS